MARLKARPQAHRMTWPLNARQIEQLDAMLQELFKAVRQILPASASSGAGVETVDDDGNGVVSVDNTDPANPVIGFDGVNVGSTLTGDGTSGSPLAVAAPRQWTTIFKTSNQTKTSDSSLATDNTLSVALSAGKLYTIRLRVFYTAHSTPDFKYQMNFSGTVNRVTMVRHSLPPNSATLAVGVGEAFDSGDVSITATTGHDGWLYAEFSIDVNTAGDFRFQWAQNTSDVNATTVYAGSTIEYRQLD